MKARSVEKTSGNSKYVNKYNAYLNIIEILRKINSNAW